MILPTKDSFSCTQFQDVLIGKRLTKKPKNVRSNQEKLRPKKGAGGTAFDLADLKGARIAIIMPKTDKKLWEDLPRQPRKCLERFGVPDSNDFNIVRGRHLIRPSNVTGSITSRWLRLVGTFIKVI